MRIDITRRSVFLDPVDPAFYNDPYPAYHAIRAELPVFQWEQYGHWCFARHEDVNALLEEEVLSTDEDYETLGGFIYELAGEVPKAGDSFEHLEWRFTVMTMKRHRIGLVKAKSKEQEEEHDRDGN